MDCGGQLICRSEYKYVNGGIIRSVPTLGREIDTVAPLSVQSC